MKQKTGVIATMALIAKVQNGPSKFAEWLISKGKAKEYQRAWQQIVALGDKFAETEAGKLNLFKATFGGKEVFSLRRMNAFLGRLEVLMDKFLIEEMLMRSGYYDLVAAEYYHRTGRFDKRDAALQTALDKALKMDEATRRRIVTRVKHHQYFYSENKESPESQAILAEYRAYAYEFCDIFKASIERLTYLQMRGKEIPEQTRKELAFFIGSLPAQPATLVALQALATKLLLNPNVDTYIAYKTAFLRDSGKLTSERYYLLTTAINAINIFPHLIGMKIREELFFWYKYSMDSNIFLEEGIIPMLEFNNIVLVFNSLGQYAPLEQFVAIHGHLIKNDREQTHSISLAECHILFGKKQFSEAIKKLEQTKPIHYTFTLWKMIIKAKCIYELREHNIFAADEIGKIKATFRRMVYKYFKGGLFNADAKVRYLNFFKLLPKLLSTKSNRKNLKELLDSFKGLSAEIKWLDEKIAELNK